MYKITAYGAGYSDHHGAIITAKVKLFKFEKIQILIGQQGQAQDFDIPNFPESGQNKRFKNPKQAENAAEGYVQSYNAYNDNGDVIRRIQNKGFVQKFKIKNSPIRI